MTAYYNEIDPFAAAWLRELIKKGLIAKGEVDERSIEDVRPDDLRGFTQCHFFAGIGVWSYALRQTGWPDDKQVWTGSCPCQPFSSAGKGNGFDDERHLWPSWYHLIRQCQPGVIFGEQVASKDGLAWLDLVHSDLEASNYTVGTADLCAAGFGAPHIRQRTWFVADADRQRSQGLMPHRNKERWKSSDIRSLGLCDRTRSFTVADSESERWHWSEDSAWKAGRISSKNRSTVNGYWSQSDWLNCTDGRLRPAEPGTLPLAYGTPARVGRLRGYGNAINAEVAKAFITAYMESVR